jgi:hypothetical protein
VIILEVLDMIVVEAMLRIRPRCTETVVLTKDFTEGRATLIRDAETIAASVNVCPTNDRIIRIQDLVVLVIMINRTVVGTHQRSKIPTVVIREISSSERIDPSATTMSAAKQTSPTVMGSGVVEVAEAVEHRSRADADFKAVAVSAVDLVDAAADLAA